MSIFPVNNTKFAAIETGSATAVLPWSLPATAGLRIGKTSLQVGSGQDNTAAILATLGDSPNQAAGFCKAFSQGGHQWFLPSAQDLMAIKDDIPAGTYWSSSELNASRTYFIKNGILCPNADEDLLKTFPLICLPIRYIATIAMPDWEAFGEFAMTYQPIMAAMQAARQSQDPPGEPSATSLPTGLIEVREGRYHSFKNAWHLVLQCAKNQGAIINPQSMNVIIQKAQECNLPQEFISTLIPPAA